MSPGAPHPPTWLGVALLALSWAICCLAVPTALWDAYVHDFSRYMLLSPSGKLLPKLAPACIACGLALAVAAVVASRLVRAKAVRRMLIALSALAAVASVVIGALGGHLLAFGCVAFVAVSAGVYISQAEKALDKS